MEQLNRIEVGGAYVGLLEDDAPDDSRAERQVKDYVAGVTRLRRRFDFWLRHFYHGDYAHMEPALRQILRVGAYDLTMLHTPAHAAVHEAVELARSLVRPGAAGLVNGVLRRMIREAGRLPRPDTGDPARDLAILHSHPTWLVRRWLDRYGEANTVRLLEWDNTRPTYGLRHRPDLDVAATLDPLALDWSPSAFLDDFVRVQRLQPILAAGLVADGTFVVQDESAGLIVRLLDPQPGETVLDLCAAPGGKTRYLADRMGGKGVIHAFDAAPGRLGLLEKVISASDMVRTEVADVRELAAREKPPAGDRVLLDAPCSGLGVLAKRADLRWNRTPEDVARMAVLQDALLDAAATLVRPGGLLVYGTCTIEPEENERRVSAFLERHPDFSLEPARGFVPEALVTREGYVALLPFRDHIDGAFGARLRRRAAAGGADQNA